MKTKMPVPYKLPSGNYRCQVMVNGKRKSVIDEDPNIAQAKAVALKNGLLQQEKKPEKLTLGEAFDRYIEIKDCVLSPSTINGYKRIRKNYMQSLMKIHLSDLTQEKIQRTINTMAKSKSPKTIRNVHALLSAVLTEFYPSLVLRTTLPQKQRYQPLIPSNEQIKTILKVAKGTENELPILLAV